MNLIAARSIVGYQDRLDGGSRLIYLPTSCYDDDQFKPKVDKVKLPHKPKDVANKATIVVPLDTGGEEPRPSRLRQLAEKIQEVELELRLAYRKVTQKS